MSELQILTCSGCGSPIALADADRVVCPSCAGSVEIPAAYRELHGARLADAQLRGDAERVLRTLDRPASLAVKVLARVLDQPMFVFLLLYGVPVGLFAILFALRSDRWLAPLVHAATPDDVPIGYTVAVAFAVLFVIAFVPRVLGIYANRRVADRGRLLRALRAHPPTIAGGPATCRLCGAPLAVATDELVATCSYCRAENAVTIETPLVAATSAIVAHLGRTIREVAALDREQRNATLRTLGRELARYLWRTTVLATAFVLGCSEDAEHKSTTLGIVGIVATVVLVFYFILRGGPPDDGPARREANDVPGWVGVVGPIVMAYVLFRALAVIEMLLA